jgi:hypothetical protein
VTRHPEWQNLALFAGGDLGWLAARRVRRHLDSCAACRAEVEGQKAALEGLQQGALSMPDGLDWDSMAAEMKANIHLGLQMGEIANSVPRRRLEPIGESLRWRAAAVCAALVVIVASGWYLERPRTPAVQSTFSLPAASGEVVKSAEIGEGVRARFVDQDSGQVTIQHVFTE